MTKMKSKNSPASSGETDQDESPATDQTQVIERPDGFYWQDKLTQKEYGPYPTLLEAETEMLAQGDGDFEEGESLEDAEDEIGIASWIDPDTGDPAEGMLPRFSDE